MLKHRNVVNLVAKCSKSKINIKFMKNYLFLKKQRSCKGFAYSENFFCN